jgi:hypothetical protein
MKDSPLDTTDMDFTPSEIDDLETIELPSSEQPKGFWAIRRKDSGLRAPFPGQLLEPFQPPTPPPGSLLYAPPGSLPPRRSIFEKTPSEEEHDERLLEEYEDSAPEPQRDTTSPPPQKPQCQRQRQLQDRMDSVQDLDQAPPPSTQCQDRRHETPRRATAFAGGVKQETQGQSSTKGCSAHRSAYHAGDSAQEDKGRPSASPTKDRDGDSTQARTATPKNGEWAKHAFCRDEEKSSEGTRSSRGGERRSCGNGHASGASAGGQAGVHPIPREV